MVKAPTLKRPPQNAAASRVALQLANRTCGFRAVCKWSRQPTPQPPLGAPEPSHSLARPAAPRSEIGEQTEALARERYERSQHVSVRDPAGKATVHRPPRRRRGKGALHVDGCGARKRYGVLPGFASPVAAAGTVNQKQAPCGSAGS